MTEQNTDTLRPATPPKTNTIWKVLKWVLIGLVTLCLILIVALYVLAKSDRGSEFLVNSVLNRVPIIQAKYAQGNLVDGVQLKYVHVNVKKTTVKVENPTLKLGWRSIFNKQVHLSELQANIVEVINSAPPTGKPFGFPKVNLPFVLRVDDLKVNQLVIQTTKAKVKFNTIKANDVKWIGPKIEFKNTQADMGYLKGEALTGYIALHEKYPLEVKGDLTIPALKKINIHTMKVKVLGSLDELKAGVATHMPDLVTGHLVAHPVRKNVPMKGQLNWQDFTWPFVQQQELHSNAGWAKVSGDLSKLIIQVDSDLVGKSIPQGTYQANLSTNLRQLNIDDFRANLMQGQVELAGVLGWQNGVSWDIQGQMKGLNAEDKLIPAVIKEFLPPNMDGKVGSKGKLTPHLDLIAHVDFDQYEDWTLKLAPVETTTLKSPLKVNVEWQNINRNMPYVGWLNSKQGDVDLILNEQGQDIYVKTDIEHNQNSMLASGQYTTGLNFKNQILTIKDFSLVNSGKKLLWGNAKINLPTKTTQMQWQANLNANQFNPNSIISSLPIQNVTGGIIASGYAKPQQQVIQLNQIELVGDLHQGNIKQRAQLKGKSNIALLFHDGQKQQGFKSYAVNYNGDFGLVNGNHPVAKSKNPLILKLSGTPTFINFDQVYHQGAAGKIDARGKLGFGERLYWDINGQFDQFKPYVFNKNFFKTSDFLQGRLNTRGEWSSKAKAIQVQQLELEGQLNGKPLLGNGSIYLNGQGNHLKLSNNNRLTLSYAKNLLEVRNKNSQADTIELRIKANDLSAINIPNHRLNGNVAGIVEFGLVNNGISLASLANLKANLVANNLNYNDTLKVQKAHIVGSVPTSNTQADQLNLLVDNIDFLTYDTQEQKQDDKKSNINGVNQQNMSKKTLKSSFRLNKVALNLEGKKQDHVLKFAVIKDNSSIGFALKGGFKEQNLWQGYLQNSLIRAVNTKSTIGLKQEQSAFTTINLKQNKISIGEHCWVNQQVGAKDKTCFNAPIELSASEQKVNATIEAFDLSNLNVLLPTDMKLVGGLTGQINLNHNKNTKKLDLNADLTSLKGKILVGNNSAFNYDKVKISAQKNAENNYELIAYVDKSKDLPKLIDIKVYADNAWNIKDNSKIVLRRMNLNILKPFIADTRILEGDLAVDIDLSGKITQPILKKGDIKVKQGKFALNSVPVDLKDIDALVSLQGSAGATIKSTFKSGNGVGLLTGNIDNLLTPNMLVKLRLDGAHLRVLQPPLVRAAVSPQLDIEISPSKKDLKVNGFIGIPTAIISMPEATPNVVSVSPDVRIVNYKQQLAYIKASQPWNIEANIDVQLNASQKDKPLQNNRVIFSAFDSQIPLTGRVQMTQKGREIALRATGYLAVDNKNVTTIQAYGQSLTLKTARARFSGELANPTLEIEATKNVQSVAISLNVTGEVANPRLRVINDAGLSEQESINALVTGRISSGASGVSNAEGFKSDVNNTIAAAGISMGLGGTRAFTNQLGRSFGLQGLSLDAQGIGDDTQVSVTGYITPDLYLRYGVGIFTPVNTLTMRYQVNRRVYMEATSSLERAVDVFYNWRF